MSTFLAQLATLRDFLSGMGFHVEDNNTVNYHRIASTSIISGNSQKPAVSERELREILQSTYNVESALEYFISRLTSGSDDGGDIGGGRSGADSDSRNAGGNDLFGTDSASYAGMAPAAASTTTTMKATTSASGATTMSPFETHNTNNSSKRFKINHGRGDSSASIGARNDSGDGGGAGNKSMKTSHNHIIIDRRNHTATSTNYNPNRRLLLCKRWTVATSTNPQRGGCNVRYGEMLDFGENYVTTTASSCKSLNRRIGGGPTVGKDPMVVRFRSYSSSSPSLSRGGSIIQGTLSRYLSSILSPLLRYLPTDESESVGDLITIEGKTMMEDYGLVIGSEIPIVLEVYINDPVRFFGLFHCQQQHQLQDNDEIRGGPAYLAHLKGGGGGGWKKKNKGNNRSTYNIYVAEAAFRLLQWAEKGGEEEEAFVLAQESVVVAENKEEQGTLAGRKNYLDTGVNRSSLSSFNDDDGDDDCFDRSERERGRDRDENVIALEVDGEVVVDEEEVDDKFSQLLLSSASDDRNNLQSKAMPELSDPKGFRQEIALRPYQRQALHFMCRREGVVIEDEMENIDYDDIDEELNSILAEQLQPSSSTSSKDNASNQIWDGAAAYCTCGPVVVRDETVASGAIPVIEYNGSVTAAVYHCDGKRGKYTHHPLWQRRYLVAADDFNSVFAFYVNELTGTASSRLPKPPKKCCGGILADAMGLGKTVMLLALILKTKENEVSGISPENPCETSTVTPRARSVSRQIGPPKDENESEYQNNHDDDGNDDDDKLWADEGSKMVQKRPIIKAENSSNGTTLVIAPLSLISQWEEEMSTKTNLSHMLYYDSSTKRRICCDDFACVDVVVTTYGTVQSLFDAYSRNGSAKSSQKHSLFNLNWRRIILDEAHVVKNPSTLISKACCTLNAESRWCVTGTPIQNSLQDVYGLLKFLRHEPWCGAAFWRGAVTNFISDVASCDRKSSDNPVDVNNDTKDYSSIAAFGRVRRLLAPILLRRTKATLTEDGTPIISLPPIDYSVVRVTLSPPEREFYNALLERSQSIFEGFIVAGTASKSWFAIFSLLQRLRQACDHVSLIVSKNTSEIATKYIEHAQDESASNAVERDFVDNDFLSGLLIKFRNASNGMIASASGESASGESTFVKQVAETLSKSVQSSDEFLKSECPICLEEPRVVDAVYTPCAHMFCRDCLLSVFREQMIRSKDTKVTNAPAVVVGGTCPVCHDSVKMSSIVHITKSVNGQAVSKFLDQPLTQSDKENSPNASTEINQRISTARVTLESALNGASSSKLEAILEELEKVRNDGKILIFSQYLGFLDIIGKALDKLGVETFRIDGKLSLKERVSAMSNFNKSQQGSVFLISMKAGGVGLNLVAASTVFIVDPWWNQALEDQCINRIHRIGQRAKIVRVRKFVVTDSVEEKIVNLQGKKKGMANEILRGADDGDQLESAAKPSLEDFKLLLGR